MSRRSVYKGQVAARGRRRVRVPNVAPKRKNRGKLSRANPRCPNCNFQYRHLKTGETFWSVSESLWAEVLEGSRRRKTVHTVLGRWHELKQQMWKQHLRDCEENYGSA